MRGAVPGRVRVAVRVEVLLVIEVERYAQACDPRNDSDDLAEILLHSSPLVGVLEAEPLLLLLVLPPEQRQGLHASLKISEHCSLEFEGLRDVRAVERLVVAP